MKFRLPLPNAARYSTPSIEKEKDTSKGGLVPPNGQGTVDFYISSVIWYREILRVAGLFRTCNWGEKWWGWQWREGNSVGRLFWNILECVPLICLFLIRTSHLLQLGSKALHTLLQEGSSWQWINNDETTNTLFKWGFTVLQLPLLTSAFQSRPSKATCSPARAEPLSPFNLAVISKWHPKALGGTPSKGWWATPI